MNPAVVTTVLAAAQTYDLTDLDTVKDELGISNEAQDAWLLRAIGQVSSSIMIETGRVFAPEFLQDVIDVRRGRSQVPRVDELQLSRWPVLDIVAATQTFDGTTIALTDGVDIRVDPDTGLLQRLDSNGRVRWWEALPLTVTYSAGYGALVQETQTVTAGEVTVAKASRFSADQSVAYASGALLQAVGDSPGPGQYIVAEGVYGFSAADEGQPLSFAYTTLCVPPDLVEIVLRLITDRFKAKARDPALIQLDTPGVGTQRFWFGAAPGQRGVFPPEIAGALDRYRMPSLG